MAVDLLAYAFVSAGGQPPTCTMQAASPDVAAYLEEHLTDLRGRGRSGASPPAEFLAPGAQRVFNDLLSQDQQVFEASATALAQALQAQLHGATKDGLFVALNATLQDQRLASVLKLEVTEQYAGVLEDVAGGQRTLAAVRNLLDRPGELQKGAIFPDPRPDSELIVGDKLTTTSLYFLTAIGARQAQKPTLAIVEVAKVLQQVAPDRAESLIENLAVTDAGTPGAFLDAQPDLDEPTRARALTLLTQRPRPVQFISRDRALTLKARVRADGIEVTGRVRDIAEKVSWDQTAAGGWTIHISVDQEPRKDYL